MATVEIKGGDKFEAALLEIARMIDQPKTLKVGFMSGAVYPNGTSVAMVAAIHNYGAPAAGIPPRPFFSNMIADKSPEWPDAIAGLLKSTRYDVDETLKRTGETIAGQLLDSILNGKYAPLKPATIARKGFDQPLVDTGRMKDSITYKIE